MINSNFKFIAFLLLMLLLVMGKVGSIKNNNSVNINEFDFYIKTSSAVLNQAKSKN
jgi:hypothetical protein